MRNTGAVHSRIILGVLLSLPAMGTLGVRAQEKEGKAAPLASLSRVEARLKASPKVEALHTASGLAEEARGDWEAFQRAEGKSWNGLLDRRTGRVTFAQGPGIPWIPGAGNHLSNADLSAHLAGKTEGDAATLERVARGFLPRLARVLGADANSLSSRVRSSHPASYVWILDFDVQRNGLPVEGAHVTLRVNNGNLIQFGSENLPWPGATVPAVRLSRKAARAALAAYLGEPGDADAFVDEGSLHLLSVNVDDARFAEGFETSRGRGIVAAWQFVFARTDEAGTWRARVDATTGSVLELVDLNDYAQVTGGVYLGAPDPVDEVVRPMPFGNVVSEHQFVCTNSAGRIDASLTEAYLSGCSVNVNDQCGPIGPQYPESTGNACFATSGGTDCTTPGAGGAGNTHAARTTYYQVNRAKEIARGWLCPDSRAACAWLDQPLDAKTNLIAGTPIPVPCPDFPPVYPRIPCNAYWDGCQLNFARSCEQWSNFGESGDVVIHEFGHGLDANDGTEPAEDDKGTGETYGDVTAALVARSSCMGEGMSADRCAGEGDRCRSCTGIRDIDWAQHESGVPHDVNNFIRARCCKPDPLHPTSCLNSGYPGACGQEGHCESQISSEALWDLGARDLNGAGSNAAWTIVERLWYLSRPGATRAFTCDSHAPDSNHSGDSAQEWQTDGCSIGSYYNALLAVDDDDGNLGNGTPHGCSIYAAFDRHGIACPLVGPPACATNCKPPASPAFDLAPGDGQVEVSWSRPTIGDDVTYDVYRNEVGCDHGFAKVAHDFSKTIFKDTQVANGVRYFYHVVAHSVGNKACASDPGPCESAVPSGFTLAAAAVGSGRIDLSWSVVAGSGKYLVRRSATGGGHYADIAEVAPFETTYSDTGLTAGKTYYYRVQAIALCLLDDRLSNGPSVNSREDQRSSPIAM